MRAYTFKIYAHFESRFLGSGVVIVRNDTLDHEIEAMVRGSCGHIIDEFYIELRCATGHVQANDVYFI